MFAIRISDCGLRISDWVGKSQQDQFAVCDSLSGKRIQAQGIRNPQSAIKNGRRPSGPALP
jgi:hypothetical protein